MARAVIVCAVLLCGCPGAVIPAAKAALVVEVATLVRRYVCARELDPILGDPRARSVTTDAAVLQDAAHEP